ncbi:MAG: class I SAM-dependent methyltransferase [Calditrichaeota bacterium]|nr:MAG: class I SAM-dependent methyltransferase [Calditrichota bacterium]
MPAFNPTSFSAVRETFDGYAHGYRERFNLNPLGHYQREQVHRIMAEYLRSGDRILDVGCGPGSDFPFYKALNLRVDAIDISPEMVTQARQVARNLFLSAGIRQASLEAFSAPSTYDAVILNFGVINALSPLSPVLDKLGELVASGGVLFLTVMPPFHLFWMMEMIVRGQWRKARQRLFGRQVVVGKKMQCFYYRQKDIERATTFPLRVDRRVHLGAVLPTPEQYARFPRLRGIAHVLLPLDRRLSTRLPDAAGGDHVCYVLRHL